MPSKKQREEFWSHAHRAEHQYSVALRQIAAHIGNIVKAFPIGGAEYAAKVDSAMRMYSQMLGPWAQAAARRMLADVARRNQQAWIELSKDMGTALKQEIANAPTGLVMQQLMSEQVQLITSLPLEASQRIHLLVIDGLSESTRGADIEAEILRQGNVSRSRATLIARTETARATTSLTQARATHVGSEGYIWRTAKDQIVRLSHQRMEGKYVRWNEPPTLSDGTVCHAGCIYNCRCYPEPVIPDIFG